jgi:hypothetical protein
VIYNEYVGLYFFSAVFQGNMALLALLGVFVVFKRQVITSELQGKDNAIIAMVQNYLDKALVAGHHVAMSYESVAELPAILKSMSEGKGYPPNVQAKAKPLNDDPNFKARFAERQSLIDKRKNVLNLMAPPFAWILGIIIFSLLIMPFAHSIHAKLSCVELPVIIATVVGNIWALAVAKKFVWKMLSD